MICSLLSQPTADQTDVGDEGRETSELAIASLFLSIVWLFGLGSIAGLYLGRRSLREISGSEGRIGGRGIAIAGMVVGVAGLMSLALVIAFVVDSAH